MIDCHFCAEMPAVVNARWCEPCWSELEEARKRVEHLQAFHDRAEALSKTSAYSSTRGLLTRLTRQTARLSGYLARTIHHRITSMGFKGHK